MTTENPRASIGGNRMLVTDFWKQENETLAQRIADDNRDLSERKTKLLAEAAELPKVIKNEEQSGKFSDLVKRMRTLYKEAEAIRVATKAPVLEAEYICDSLFGKFKKALEDQITELNRRGTIYDTAVEDKKRAVLEAAALKAREEEDRARREAEKAAKKANTDKAIDAAETAAAARNVRVEAERAADVAPAELTRSRGEMSVSSLVETYHGEITDYEKVDLNALRKYLSRSELDKAAERAGKDLKADGVGTIKGVRIYSVKERRVA